MLAWLANYFSQTISALNVFHYITFRAILAALTSLLFSLWFGPYMIQWLKDRQLGQQIRKLGPQSHYSKSGTPTMGGALILLAIVVSTLLWGDLSNRFTWVLLGVTVGFGMIGYIDDALKIRQKNSDGLSAKMKYGLQSLFGLITVLYLYSTAVSPQETNLIFPFFKEWVLPLGAFYIVLGYFVIVGTSNAVNLTDGLDGLAILPTALVGGALGIFAYITGHAEFSAYLAVPFVPGSGEVAVFCSALVGAGLGFLWFNAYPAQVFMGDVGSLALGAALGTIALIVRQEIVLFIMGGVFVMETVSVILQVGAFKLTGKRIFKMAPIHHHFELVGWPEPKIIVRFWILTVILVLIGLATLKLR